MPDDTSQQLPSDLEFALRVLKTISPREEEVLKARFGLGGTKLSQEQIAARLGVTPTKIEEITKTALRKLRHPTRSRTGQWLPLGDVLDALRAYRRCFSVFPNPTADWAQPVVHVVCDPAALDEFRKRSVIHDYLARTSIAALTSGPNR